ncbi:HEAT repeat domain-containing protein [Longimicrobium sp.]|uniref:HEAT repeat domain-containing protein n=1 Tax=Longimicrobium sp. TaxID=2029185 RepID=UPI002CD913D0|nr:HEAT repeat domain-containing protein [Longimicrobium sp.]HSU12774.1 HEAT repeat domain-containing protein [Longimicrobium sp.]
MTRIERFARRHPAGTAAMAGLALLALPATLLPRPVRHPAGDGDRVRAAASVSAAAQDGSGARALVTAVRGANPVLCDLVSASVGNGWGWGSGDDEDAPSLARRGEPSHAALDWLSRDVSSPAEVAVLREGLADADACVRRVSARLLGRGRTQAGTDALLDALRSGDATRRDAAIFGIAFTDDARAVAPLVSMLDDGDAEVRGGAAWALGHLEKKEATPALARVLRDREARVRRAAARALGRLEDPAAVPALAQLLGGDPDPTVRRAAAWALGKIE